MTPLSKIKHTLATLHGPWPRFVEKVLETPDALSAAAHWAGLCEQQASRQLQKNLKGQASAPPRLKILTDIRPVEIHWGTMATPFGPGLLAHTENEAIVALSLCASPEAFEEKLRRLWRGVPLKRWRSTPDRHDLFPPRKTTTLLLTGTPFQQDIWKELARVPRGAAMTYGELATRANHPGAIRAVGSAMAANRIGYLLPCHRIVRQGGHIGDFAWGPEAKRLMLLWDALH